MDAAVAAAKNDDSGEGPWALPGGWCWTRTDAVAVVNPLTNFDTLDPASEIPFIPMAAVAEESGKIDLSARRPLRDVAKGYVRFMEGDVIFAKITPCMENGKVAPVLGLPGGYAAGSTEFHVFRPAAVVQRYLWYWLVGRGFRGRAKRNMSGSAGQLRVPVDWLREDDFPLAPLAEQRRIVARIDALFAEIAEGEAALAAARKGLDTFRRALLKAAVTGELTKDWRAANPVTETGHGLLAHIAKDRTDQAPAKGRGRRDADTPLLDTSALPALPEGWAWATLESIAAIGTGGTPLRSNKGYWEKGRVAWFTSAATNLPFASKPKELITERAILETTCRVYPAGTLLVAMYGEGKTRGQITELAIPAACNQACAALQFANPELREWIKQWFGSFYLQLRAQAAGGVQPNLNLEIIKSLSVPIPPPAEAVEILHRVSAALAATSDTLAVLDAEAADAARLKQSILKAAFEGRLVPQDPADESATALLARMAANPVATRAGRGRAKSR